MMAGRPGNPGLRGRLLNASIDAYVLSLETINRLSVKYRVESFAFLICNAWELILKAKILDDLGDRRSIFYPKKRGEPVRSLALRDCVKKVFPNEKDPTRRNIERVADLRDEGVHLVISIVPRDVMGIFQACVLNYHTCLVNWFGVSLSDRVPVGMMTLVYDLSPDECDLSSRVLRRRLGSDAAKYLMSFQGEIRQEFDDLGKPAEFAIAIGYHLAVVKDENRGEITMYAGGSGQPTAIVEVPRDPCRTHPYRQKEVIELLDKQGIRINSHDVQCVLRVHKVRSRQDFYYRGSISGSFSQYSSAFVEWLVKQWHNDPQFFLQCRQRVREEVTRSAPTKSRDMPAILTGVPDKSPGEDPSRDIRYHAS